jgi:chemotaxis protein MotB
MAEEQGTTIIIKKIKKGGHGHHGGAWKVAYADFVTAMMAFFLLMWIMGQSQQMKEGIQRYFNDPLKYLFGSEKLFNGMFDGSQGRQVVSTPGQGGVTDSNKSGGISRLHLLAQKIEVGMTPFKSEVFDFKVHPDRIQFAITAQSLFSPGAFLLKPEAESVLNRIAGVLKNIDAQIMIEAHTDDTPTDSPDYATNWELSALRAATVVRYFVEGQLFDPSKLSAMAGAEYRPIADNRTPEGRAKNRRIDIYVIPDKDNRFQIRSLATEGKPPGK